MPSPSLFFLPFRPAIDANGLSVSGAKLNFYATGTTTKQPVYTSESLTTELPNPVQANSAGVWPSIYLDDTKVYRLVLTDANDIALPNGDFDPYTPLQADKGDPGPAGPPGENQRAFADIAALLASEITSAGEGVTWTAGPLVYAEAPALASDHDIETAEGVKLYAVPDPAGYVSFEQLGAVGDGVTDDRAVFVAASGRRVRGKAGSTYFIDINAIADSIELLDGTDWEFPDDCEILWDAIQLPLFWSNDPDCHFRHVRPQIVYKGVPPAALPHPSQGYYTPTLGGATSGSSGYYTTYYISGVASATLIRPKFRAQTPGPGKSIYRAIDLRPLDNSGTRGGTVYIESPEFDDIVFGIIGSGYERLVIRGRVYGGRYDSYTNGALAWGAPAHLLYFSDELGFNEVSIDGVWDAGLYQGNDAGHVSAETFKSYRLANASIGPIVSFRPHGVLDGGGYQNCQFSDIFWRTDKDSSDVSWTRKAFRTSTLGGAEGAINNVSFGNVTLIYKTIEDTAFLLTGAANTAYPNSGISFAKIRIEGALALPAGEQILQFYNCDRVSADVETYLTGGAADDGLVRFDSCDRIDLRIKNLGPTKLTYTATQTSLGASTNLTVGVDQVDQPTAFFQDEGDKPQTELQVYGPVKAGTFGFARVTGTTAGAKTFKLPIYGYYELVAVASGLGTHSVTKKFAINWRGPSAGGVQTIGTAFTQGTDISDVTCALNNATGIVTITGTRAAAGNVELQIIPIQYGAWTLYGA